MNDYNRTDAATKLLADVEGWCRKTGSVETLVGRVLFRHPGFVGLLRKRLTATLEKEKIVRAFLADNPEGWNGKLPKCSGYGVTRPQGASPLGMRVLRDGLEDAVRKLDGCERFKLPDGVAEAAKIDGRPYTEFLSALMWMGLECWKDDRSSVVGWAR